jgi:hypothetical protein
MACMDATLVYRCGATQIEQLACMPTTATLGYGWYIVVAARMHARLRWATFECVQH